MAVDQKYFHDRVVLSLLSLNTFLTLFVGLSVLLRLESSGTSSGVIVQYRSNLGISAFKSGNEVMLIGFIVFALLMLAVHVTVSLRTYQAQRNIALGVLSLGAFLLLVSAVVVNALLALH